jgi:hypothetical protein
MVWCVHVERVSTTRTPVRFAVRSNHGHRPPQPNPDGITTAQLARTASRYASRQPLDVEAAVAELREIATGRGDLLAERAGLILAFRDEDERDGRWPRRSLEAALCIAAGADLTRLTERLAEGQEREIGAPARGRRTGSAVAPGGASYWGWPGVLLWVRVGDDK